MENIFTIRHLNVKVVAVSPVLIYILLVILRRNAGHQTVFLDSACDESGGFLELDR